MKRIFFICIFLFISAAAYAADYYVDATGGNDENDGQSPALAWQTINQVNRINVQPGDTVRFKCGEAWRGQLNVFGSGTELNPITYTRYGDNCNDENKPVINAAAEINASWSQYSGNIYVADVDLTTTPPNYIPNGSFEINDSNWFKGPDNYNDVYMDFEADCVINNGGCLKYISSAHPDNDNHFNNTYQFALDAGKQYNLKFKLITEEGVQVRVIIMEWPYHAEDKAYDRTFTMGSSILDHSEVITPLNTVDNAKILFYVYAARKVVYLDDVEITSNTGEPATAKQLFLNGQHLKLAQYPNTGYSDITEDSYPGGGTGYGNGADFLIDEDLSAIAGQDLTGAGIHIRSCDWQIEDRVVDNFDTAANKLIWTGETVYAILSGYGYYLDNKLWMLDSEGEWFYDDINRKMYVGMPNNEDPNSAGVTIEASVYDYGISSVQNGNFLRSDIIIDGLNIKNASLDGVYFSGSPRFQVTNVNISNSGHDGLYALNSGGGSIEDSVIRDSVNEGIYMKNSENVYIARNLIEKSGYVGSPRNSLAAIVADDYTQLLNNTIVDSGYLGIRFMRESLIKNNVLRNSCLILNDCGAIYTWNGHDDPLNLTPYNTEVSENIVTGSAGNVDGTPKTSTRARGIYLDGYSNGITVLNNTVTDIANDGIYFRAADVVIEGNTVYGSGGAQLAMLEDLIVDNQPVNLSKDNIIENNIFFPVAPYERSLVGLSTVYDFYDPALGYYYGPFDYNTYSTLYSDIVVYERYRPASEFETILYNFPLWQQVQTYRDGIPQYQDSNSTLFEPFHILSYQIQSVDSANFLDNGSFDSGLQYWFKGPDIDGDVEMTHEPDCIFGSGGCLRYKSSANPGNDNHFNNTDEFYMNTDQTYLLKFKIAAEEEVQVRVLIWGRPYETGNVAYDKTFTVGTEALEYREVFIPASTIYTDKTRKVLFYVYSESATVYVDDVSVEEVTAEFNDPTDDSHILVNDTDQDNKVFACPDAEGDVRCSQYIDINGEVVSWPVTLNKYSSRIIVWGANPFRDIDNDLVPDPCADSDGDGYSSEGGMCGYMDIDDNDPYAYRIEDLSAKNQQVKIKLQWTCATGSGTYNIYRGTTQGGPYEQIAAGHQTDECNYFDYDPVSGRTYYYVVHWADVSGHETADSNEAAATH